MSDQRLPITGGCLCGAIRYESTEPANNGGYCHCKICQKSGGGLHAVDIFVPWSGFKFTKGEPKWYQSSEIAKRGFCGECGSSLIADFVGNPNLPVAIGSLDHPEDWSVHQEGWWGHAYVGNKVPWEIIADDLPQDEGFDRNEYEDSQT